jgi:pimeloyl-ACP methyl ester carboxylesterase
VEIEPFAVHIPDEDLDDLRERLRRSRWPDQVEGSGWEYGSNLEYLRDLVSYWMEDFDWRAFERDLNSFAHYRTSIDGQAVHFIRHAGVGPNPLPLVITHGWPSSIAEMSKVIRPLADPMSFGGDPADAFDVVVPSMPGFGFSGPRVQRGPARTHELWAQLMSGLGYERFGAQGGDIGASVTASLGKFSPERVVGMHFSSDVPSPEPAPPTKDLSAEEREYLLRLERWEKQEGAYGHLQRTRPQTLAYGLHDSPVALAAWIVEKFRAWSDCGGDIERSFTRDEILGNISIYWFTKTAASSVRNYFERAHDPSMRPLRLGERITVPTGIAMFPGERDLVVPRAYVERSFDVRRWTEMPRGGHFAALEEPELFIDDVRAFFREVRPVGG